MKPTTQEQGNIGFFGFAENVYLMKADEVEKAIHGDAVWFPQFLFSLQESEPKLPWYSIKSGLGQIPLRVLSCLFVHSAEEKDSEGSEKHSGDWQKCVIGLRNFEIDRFSKENFIYRSNSHALNAEVRTAWIWRTDLIALRGLVKKYGKLV